MDLPATVHLDLQVNIAIVAIFDCNSNMAVFLLQFAFKLWPIKCNTSGKCGQILIVFILLHSAMEIKEAV